MTRGIVISFGPAYENRHFDTVAQETMALVEEAATYLDGPGRKAVSLMTKAMTICSSAPYRGMNRTAIQWLRSMGLPWLSLDISGRFRRDIAHRVRLSHDPKR